MKLSRKEQFVTLLKSIETSDPVPVQYINPNKYIQHNLMAGDGLSGFGTIMSNLPPNSARVKTVRVFQDGDYVFTHTDYNFFGPKIGFDIVRYENGLIVEHWDNLQDTPTATNPSGHTMIDGATEVTDLDKTAANKAVIRDFYEKVLTGGRFDLLPTFFNGDHCIQHNPMLPDGITAATEAMAKAMAAGYSLTVGSLKMLLGEGNFVLGVADGTQNGKPAALYDLFRLENGKIVERWDVIEETLPKDQWQNNNGKF